MLGLCVDSRVAESIYRLPSIMWGLVPLSLFWQCRMWLSATRGYVDDDPIVYASKDWVTWTCLACGAAFYFAADGTA